MDISSVCFHRGKETTLLIRRVAVLDSTPNGVEKSETGSYRFEECEKRHSVKYIWWEMFILQILDFEIFSEGKKHSETNIKILIKNELSSYKVLLG